MNKFSQRSKKQLATLHDDLKLIMEETIKVSPIDFILVEGHRSLERQYELYKKGLSKLDGVRTKSKHNSFPSMAIDICAYVPLKPRLAYDVNHLCLIAGVVIAVADHLYQLGSISHVIRWGGNWDQDGEIITDQNFDDLPHFELFKP